jgi:putative colanic acid biosynthesis UDP-glucose lipid carrier transferase
MHSVRRGKAIQSLSGSDSSFLFVAKTLFYPVMSCVPLALAVSVTRPSGPYFILAALTSLVSNLILDIALIHAAENLDSIWADLIDILTRWLAVVLVVGAILYAGGILRSLDPRVVLVWSAVTPFALWLTLLTARISLNLANRNRRKSRKAVIVGASDVGLLLESILQQSPLLQTEMTGFFEDRSGERIPAGASNRILGRCDELAEYVRQSKTNLVYVTIPMSRQKRILDLLNALGDSTASVYFVPDLLTFNLIQGRIDTLEGLPLIAVCESPFIGLSGLIKRIMDLAISAALIIGTSPILAMVAIGVKMSSRGPVIFRQPRYGLDGRAIQVYKFRSMRVVEDGQQSYKQVTRKDPRVTRFGAFIRRASLDELPQLFNVLEGSMSLVGPRPHVVDVNERYRRLIPGYMVRHKVKPGITGLAQVNGFRGGDDIDSMSRRIECDLTYLKQWSIGLDISIILRTVLTVFADTKAY